MKNKGEKNMEKICKVCGKIINEGDKFCQGCGASVENEVVNVQNNTTVISTPSLFH